VDETVLETVLKKFAKISGGEKEVPIEVLQEMDVLLQG
jgi:hypothetical protein